MELGSRAAVSASDIAPIASRAHGETPESALMADPSEFVLLPARRIAFPRMPQLQSCTADRSLSVPHEGDDRINVVGPLPTIGESRRMIRRGPSGLAQQMTLISIKLPATRTNMDAVVDVTCSAGAAVAKFVLSNYSCSYATEGVKIRIYSAKLRVPSSSP